MLRLRDVRSPRDGDDARLLWTHAGNMLMRAARRGDPWRVRLVCAWNAWCYARRAAERG